MRVLVAVLLVLASGCERARPGIPPRHLLLVTSENVRADRTSAYLSLRPTTSLASTEEERREGRAMGLDDLAASGVRFTTCMAPSSRTVPSLASLFTGLEPETAHVRRDDDAVPEDVPTLAESFDDAGFRTAAFVTVAGGLDLERSVGRGFGEFHRAPDDATTLAAARTWLMHDLGDGARRFTWVHLAGVVPPFDRGSSDAAVEDALRERSFGTILEPPESLAVLASAAPPGEERVRAFAATYDRALDRTSLALAQWLQTVFDYTRPGADASESWARTVFVWTAPNGCLLGEGGRVGCPDGVHEQLTHVPLVLRHPDSLTGERVMETPVVLADLLPTLSDWFDLPAPRRVAGRSLLAHLDSYVERRFEIRPAVSRGGGSIGVRDEHWHLVVETTPEGRRVRLFDPAHDPAELVDLSGRRPDVVQRLLSRAGPIASAE